ncbi:hypothetical protein DUNSADRAFT_17166 [Dunaliella salina]|uniref:Agenet-like domain-containing protein n=1 Tax=Dunaliella salina TaxID=3046 RepID=A0ABQ7H0D6_DUNSA|nr:hypothetical protein DUNSADRAFT_17166 [Dunaliella salina]|eukprot:KAF5840322.1 hypothetical protein DUNSADRAFT_17166 [Dunaliella salina]
MDHFWTYNGPQCPNAVQWSQDNLLAVAGAHTAVILAPGHLDGPRASASPPNPSASGNTEGLCVGGLPKAPQESEALVWAVAGEARAEEGRDSTVGRTHVRALAWSPPGCTPNAGCYLTLVSTDSKVRMFAAPAHSLSCEWELAIDASSMLKQQLMDTDWKEVDNLVSSSLEPNHTASIDGYDSQGVQGLLRLRGGNSSCMPHVLHGGECGQSPGSKPAAAATAPGCRTAGMERPVLRLRGGGRKRKATEAPQAVVDDAAGSGAKAAGDAGRGGTAATAPSPPQIPPVSATAEARAAAAAPAPAPAEPAEAPQAVGAGDRPAAPTDEPAGQAPALGRGPSARSMARAVKAEAANQAHAQATAAPAAAVGRQEAAAQELCRRGVPGSSSKEAASSRTAAAGNSSKKGAGAGSSRARPAEGSKKAGKTLVEVDGGEAGATPSGATRRATGADLFVEGASVEVMMDEEGLRHCWFSGTIILRMGKWVLVRYEDLMESDEHSAPKLREWFPLPGASKAAARDLPDPPNEQQQQQQQQQPSSGSPKPIARNWGPGYSVRPKLPQEVSLQGCLTDLSPGDVVEVFDGGWWGADVVKVTHDSAQQDVPQEQQGHQQQDQQLQQQQQQQPATAIDGAHVADAGAPRMRVVAQVPGEDAPYVKGVEHVRLPFAWNAAKGWQRLVAARQEPNQISGQKRSGPPPTKRRKSDATGTPAGAAAGVQSAGKAAKAGSSGEEDAGDEQDEHSLQGTEAEGTAGEAARRGPARSKRGQPRVSYDESPEGRTPAARAKPSASSARGKGSGGSGGGSGGGKRRKGAKAGGPEGADTEGDGEDSDGKKQPKSSRKTPSRKPPAPPEIDVSNAAPDTFANLVPECNITRPESVAQFSSQLGAKRWLVLRHALPTEEVPRYRHAEHIKGIDSDNMHRAFLELVHLHGSALESAGVTKELLMRNMRANIRHYLRREEAAMQERESGAAGEQQQQQQQQPPQQQEQQSGRAGVQGQPAARAAPSKRGKSALLQVPASFSAEDTDPDTFTALTTPEKFADNSLFAKFAPRLVVERFLRLRARLPPEELAQYSRQEHLNETDSQLLAQSLAEMNHLHGQQLEACGLQPRVLVKKARATLRGHFKYTNRAAACGILAGGAAGAAAYSAPAPGTTPTGGPGRMLLGDAADGAAEGEDEGGSSESEEDGDDEQGQGGRPAAGGMKEREPRGTARGGRSLRDRSRLGPKKYADGFVHGSGSGSEPEPEVPESSDEYVASEEEGKSNRKGKKSSRRGSGGGPKDEEEDESSGPSSDEVASLRSLYRAGRRVQVSAPVPASGWRANFDFRSGLSDKAFDALGYQVGLHAPQEDVDLMGCGGPHYEVGASDGSVRLWGGLASSMMYEGPAGFSLLAEVAKADGQAPTCMDVALGVPDAAPAGGVFGCQACLFSLGTKLGTLALWRCEVTRPAHPTPSDITTITPHGQQPSGAGRAAEAGTAAADGAAAPAIAPASSTARGAAQARHALEESTKQQHAQRFTYLGMLQDATPPQRFNPLASYTAPKKATTLPSSKHPAMGLASSPNGLVVAVARNLCTADDGMAGNSKTMTWRRLIEGSLHLYTLYGQMQSSKQQQPQQEQQQQQQQLHLTAPLGEQGQKEGRGRADGERGEGDGVLPGGVGQAADGGNVQGEAQQGQNAGQQQQQQQQEGQDALLAPGGLLDSLLPALACSTNRLWWHCSVIAFAKTNES